MRRVEESPRVLILRMPNVIAIYATGLQTLEDLFESMQRRKGTLILSAVGAQPLTAMRQSGFLECLGEENVAEDIFAALERARRAINFPAHVETV